MRISAFSMCRNADSLYYPVEESIRSVLDLVDEMVIAVGEGLPGDRSVQIIQAIDSPKIRIIRTNWDIVRYPKGTVHAQQTDLAKEHCTGDWLIYLQADEVLHEGDHHEIFEACRQSLSDPKVEGFLFHYLHFWGDYEHLVTGHSWYEREIRIVRNQPEIHSWQSAQSFRWYDQFTGNYQSKYGNRKLRVRQLNARIYHYGWVRPPALMTQKMNALDQVHSHKEKRFSSVFDYGNLSKMSRFNGSHPAVMQKRIQQLDWEDGLKIRSHIPLNRKKMKHEKWRYRMLSFIEEKIVGGKRLGVFRNYTLID
ncbi:MAG: hypothetical protein WEC59_05745 [Salibacteraceae bacterium]